MGRRTQVLPSARVLRNSARGSRRFRQSGQTSRKTHRIDYTRREALFTMPAAAYRIVAATLWEQTCSLPRLQHTERAGRVG